MKKRIVLIGFFTSIIVLISSCSDNLCTTYARPKERLGMTDDKRTSYKERSSIPSPYSAKYKNKLVRKYSD